jgi:nucleoside-diphosphate-sugar epimerase
VDDPINKVVVPAINGTLNVLNSAHKYGKNVKHFVFTSSMAAVINIELDPAHVIDEEDWNDAITEKVYKQREEGQEIDAIVAYFASKNESERAFWRFKEENKPSFAMTTILPSYCFGPILPPAANDDAVQAASTSRMLADYFSGKAQDTSLNPQPFSFYVHIADVGRAHVLATKNLDKANGERYIVSAGSFNFQEAVDIMRENYPDRQHIITNGEPGNYPKSTRTADGSKVTRHLGLQYTDFKTTVLDSVKGLENVYKL